MWESEDTGFKVVSWPYSYEGPGYALVCLRSGKSGDDWFASPEEALRFARNNNVQCECRKCVDEKIFEEVILGARQNDKKSRKQSVP